VPVGEPATLVAIIYYLIKDCLQAEDTVFSFFKTIMCTNSAENPEVEYFRYALSASQRSKDTNKYRIEFPVFFKMAARTYLKYIGMCGSLKKHVNIKKINEIPGIIEKEEDKGWDYSPYGLKEMLLMPKRVAM
jgi:hypothetical protein